MIFMHNHEPQPFFPRFGLRQQMFSFVLIIPPKFFVVNKILKILLNFKNNYNNSYCDGDVIINIPPLRYASKTVYRDLCAYKICFLCGRSLSCSFREST